MLLSSVYFYLLCLRCLANDQHGATSWATGGNDTWDKLKKGFRSLSKPFGSLAEKGVVFVCTFLLIMSHIFLWCDVKFHGYDN